MGVPSVSGIAKESPGSAEPGSDREVLAVEMSLSLLQSPREGHSTSRAGCSKACSPFPAFSWHYWDDFGLVSSLLSSGCSGSSSLCWIQEVGQDELFSRLWCRGLLQEVPIFGSGRIIPTGQQ